jgi:hypothetical protein
MTKATGTPVPAPRRHRVRSDPETLYDTLYTRPFRTPHDGRGWLKNRQKLSRNDCYASDYFTKVRFY